MDERISKLSNTIVNYSLQVKENDKVLITIENTDCNILVKQLIKDIIKNNGIVDVRIIDNELNSLIMENANDGILNNMTLIKQFEVDNYDCFIKIRYTENEYESKNILQETYKKLGEKTKEIDDIRINERRWVLLNYPSVIDAYKAHMKTEEFYNYAFDVMTVDYKKMGELIEPLKELMEKTDKVHITGPGTDLTFSIKDIPAIPCCGDSNIPDGEIFTAPVKESVNGYITYNTPSPYQGNIYNNIRLEFRNGAIVNCSCSESDEELKKIFETDKGAKYVGEFALGINPSITEPMGDILYDEKIMGSLHFTPGRCYGEAPNGNTSSIHWDLVLIQTPEYGGGEIYFDDVLIRKDGKFTLNELQGLNQ